MYDPQEGRIRRTSVEVESPLDENRRMGRGPGKPFAFRSARITRPLLFCVRILVVLPPPRTNIFTYRDHAVGCENTTEVGQQLSYYVQHMTITQQSATQHIP